MRAIVRKKLRRKLVEVEKGELVFKVRDNEVEPRKIDRWMERYKVPESALYAPSPAACKSKYSRYGHHTLLTCRSHPVCCRLSNCFRARFSSSKSCIFSSSYNALTRTRYFYRPESPNVLSCPLNFEHSSASRQHFLWEKPGSYLSVSTKHLSRLSPGSKRIPRSICISTVAPPWICATARNRIRCNGFCAVSV
jgi:hypothetical protein